MTSNGEVVDATPSKSPLNNDFIWIGNLSFNTKPSDLRTFFQEFKSLITRIDMPEKKDSNGFIKNLGFARIYFNSPDAVSIAVETKNETALKGRSLLIKSGADYRKQSGTTTTTTGSSSPSATLFIGNLAFECVSENLKKVFEAYGKIHKVRLSTFEDSGKCKGFAYVDYVELNSATEAYRSLRNKLTLNKRKIRVEYASVEATKRGRPWLEDSNNEDTNNSEDHHQSFPITTTTHIDHHQLYTSRRPFTSGTGTNTTKQEERGGIKFLGKKIKFPDN